ncbi:MAG: hypothetical protein V1702_00840 [Candidatus Woesearchaeota archaeon]
MAAWKSIDEQIKETNEFFKQNAILLVLSFVLTYLLSKVIEPNLNIFGAIQISALYLMSGLLFTILILQLFDNILEKGSTILTFQGLWHSFKRMNWIFTFLMAFMMIFFAAFSVEYFLKFSKPIGASVGMSLGLIIGVAIQLLSIIIPGIFLRFIINSGAKIQDFKTKLVWLIMPGIVLGIIVPLLAYLLRRNWMDIFILPVVVLTMAGWILLVEAFKIARKPLPAK